MFIILEMRSVNCTHEKNIIYKLRPSLSYVSVFQYHFMFCFLLFAKFSWPVSLTPSNGARKEAHFCLPKYTLHVSMCVRLCNLIKYIEYPKHLHYSILMIARQFYLDFGCVLTTFSFVLTILSKNARVTTTGIHYLL